MPHNYKFYNINIMQQVSLTPHPSQPPSLPKYNILIFCNCIYKTCMIHSPQQLVKELFALNIIGIVVLEFVLYCDSPFTLVAMLSQA